MFDLLWIPLSFLGVPLVYSLLGKWSGRAASAPTDPPPSTSAPFVLNPGASASACARIMEITPTNNSYDAMGDVLASLELDQVREILGGPLRASMEGYML